MPPPFPTAFVCLRERERETLEPALSLSLFSHAAPNTGGKGNERRTSEGGEIHQLLENRT